MKNVKKNKKLDIVSLILMFLFGALAIYAGSQYAESGTLVSFGEIFREEYLAMIAIFLIVLPILLVGLVCVVLFLKKEEKHCMDIYL